MFTKDVLYSRAKDRADESIRNLRRIMLKYNISQEILSRLSHVDAGNLSKILSGVIYPNFKTWCRLDLSVKYLAHPDWFDSETLEDNLPF